MIRKNTPAYKKDSINGGLFKNCYICSALVCAGMIMICSCTTINLSPDDNAHEQIKAENRVMKQTITLAVRENSVLKEENIKYKSETGKLKAKTKLLESEIESLNKKHEQDIALLTEKYDNLNRKNTILEQESSSKIRELTDINRALEEKMTNEVTRLNENIRSQEERFNNERAALETSFTSKEQEYQKQLAQLKKDILTANMEMESLKSRLAETDANLKSAEAEKLKLEEANRNLRKKIDSLSGSAGVKQDDAAKSSQGTQ